MTRKRKSPREKATAAAWARRERRRRAQIASLDKRLRGIEDDYAMDMIAAQKLSDVVE